MSQTKAQLIDPVDGTIVNADINASAAIAGSKISPAFSANITTTGNAVIGGTTINTAQDKALSIFGTNGSELKLQATNFGGTAADGGAALTCTFGSLFLTNNNANGDIHFQTKVSGQSTSEKMRLTEAGKLGIGTTSPGASLHTNLAAENGSIAQFGLSGQTNNQSFIIKADDSDSLFTFRFGSSNSTYPAVRFNMGADVEAIRITSSGSVGIGTTSPDQLIHINKTSGTTLFKASVAGNSTIGLEIQKTGSTTQSWRIVDGQTVNGKLEFYDVTDSATRMCIDGSGNVGIGTSSPSQLLSLKNTSAQCQQSLTAATNGSCAIYFGDTDSVNRSVIYHHNTGDYLAFYTAGSERMRIDSSGKVAIGTDTSNTSSNAPLTIKSSGSSATRFNLVNSGSSSVESTQIFSQNNELAFTASGSEKLRILNGGGITFNGDTAAANALDDYEEGTFTPAFSNGLVFSSYETNGQRGVYTKIGRFVYGTIRLDGAIASTQNTNQIKISGLPFTSVNFSNGEQVGGADPFFQDGFYNSNDFSGIVNNNSSVIQLVKRSDGASLTGTSVNGGRQIRISFWYMAA